MGTPGHEEIDSIKEHETAPKLQKKDMVRQYINGKGERRFTGGGDLKASQAYPVKFSILCLVKFCELFWVLFLWSVGTTGLN